MAHLEETYSSRSQRSRSRGVRRLSAADAEILNLAVPETHGSEKESQNVDPTAKDTEAELEVATENIEDELHPFELERQRMIEQKQQELNRIQGKLQNHQSPRVKASVVEPPRFGTRELSPNSLLASSKAKERLPSPRNREIAINEATGPVSYN